MTVAHLYYVSAHCCGFGVMSDHDDGLIEPVIQFLKHVEDEGGILGIKIAGWLVGQNDRRPRYHRSRQSYALLFTARELQRLVMKFVFESEQV